jgi:hypothetical protein
MTIKVGIRSFRTISVDLQDRRIWSRALRSYKSATGDGIIENDEPFIDHGLCALIPLINAHHVRALWDAGAIENIDPRCQWFAIDRFDLFRLEIQAVKFQTRMFSGYRWLASFGFWFGFEIQGCPVLFNWSASRIAPPEGPALKSGMVLDGIGFSNTKSIADLFLLVDQLMLGEWPLTTLQDLTSQFRHRDPFWSIERRGRNYLPRQVRKMVWPGGTMPP